MKLSKIVTIIIALIMLASFASHSLALDQAGEEKYKKARMLLKESKVDEAKKIFKELSGADSADFKVSLGMIDATLEEARVLKAKKDKGWKSKVYEAFGKLKGIFRANAASPAIYVSFAKSYWINDRFGKAERSLKKAFYYDSGYADAYILKGDMFYERSKEGRVDPFNESADDSYESQRIARTSYEQVITSEDKDPYMQAMMNYKLGELYGYHSFKGKCKEFLTKALETSPDSYWGIMSKEKLSKL